MKDVALLLVMLVEAALLAGLAHALRVREHLEPLLRWWRDQNHPIRFAAVAALVLAASWAVTKPAPPGDEPQGDAPQGASPRLSSVPPGGFTAAERAAGYALGRVGTGESFSFAMPDAAEYIGNAHLRGAHRDGWWVAPPGGVGTLGTNFWDETFLCADGTLTFGNAALEIPFQAVPGFAAAAVVAPLQGNHGFAPQVSRIWTAPTRRGSRLFTWENAFQDRLATRPANFQAEFLAGGDIVFRFSGLRRDGEPCGLNIGGAVLAPWLPSNATSVTFANITGLGSGTGDADGDGLPDAVEIRAHGTSPFRADTDGDGLSDTAELAAGTNPLDPDTDGDGIPDGWTRAQYESHPLFTAVEGVRDVEISLLAPALPENGGVLRVGNLPLLLSATNAWSLHLPDGASTDVALTTCGASAALSIRTGTDVFVEDDGVFTVRAFTDPAPRLMAAGNSPSTGGGTAGRPGATARIHCPHLILDPPFQTIHGNGSAFIRAICAPLPTDAPSPIDWQFAPDEIAPSASVLPGGMEVALSRPHDGYCLASVYAQIRNEGRESLSTVAFVEFCDGWDPPSVSIDVGPECTNATISLSGHTCSHDPEDDTGYPQSSFEIEAGRHAANGVWQHLAWIDTDPATPGRQRRSPFQHDSPPVLSWDMKADADQPQARGVDTLDYTYAQDGATRHLPLRRVLPAVEAGEYVPPPYAEIVMRTYDRDNQLLGETRETAPIPQFVQVAWENAAPGVLARASTFAYAGSAEIPATNVILYAGCQVEEAQTALATLPGRIQALFPANANIAVVGPDTHVPQPHKTILIKAGYNPSNKKDLGLTPNESCHAMNSNPTGTSFVYLSTIHDSLESQFRKSIAESDLPTIDYKNGWRQISLPVPMESMVKYMAYVAVHECAHSLGLVPKNMRIDIGHNSCTCGWHHMDNGKMRFPPMYLHPNRILFWAPSNAAYLEFILRR